MSASKILKNFQLWPYFQVFCQNVHTSSRELSQLCEYHLRCLAKLAVTFVTISVPRLLEHDWCREPASRLSRLGLLWHWKRTLHRDSSSWLLDHFRPRVASSSSATQLLDFPTKFWCLAPQLTCSCELRSCIRPTQTVTDFPCLALFKSIPTWPSTLKVLISLMGPIVESGWILRRKVPPCLVGPSSSPQGTFLTSSGSFLTAMFAKAALPLGSHNNLQTCTIERGLCCGHMQLSTRSPTKRFVFQLHASGFGGQCRHQHSAIIVHYFFKKKLCIGFPPAVRCRRCQDPRSHNDRKWSLKIFLNISNLRTHTPCSVQMTVAAPIYIIVICWDVMLFVEVHICDVFQFAPLEIQTYSDYGVALICVIAVTAHIILSPTHPVDCQRASGHSRLLQNLARWNWSAPAPITWSILHCSSRLEEISHTHPSEVQKWLGRSWFPWNKKLDEDRFLEWIFSLHFLDLIKSNHRCASGSRVFLLQEKCGKQIESAFRQLSCPCSVSHKLTFPTCCELLICFGVRAFSNT